MSALTTITLVVAIMPRHVLLLTLTIATLIALVRLLIIRSRVLCVIRVCILSESRHEVAHVIAITLEPPELLLKGDKVIVLL